MEQKFSDRVFERVKPLWNSYLEHPFVKGIGEGNVDEEKFKHYMKQDYIYLIEYSRVFAIGAAKAHNLKTMTMFANLLSGTMNYEMDLHREYAARFGISNEELEATEPSATVTAYTSYMLNKAQNGGVENAIASVWPAHGVIILSEKNLPHGQVQPNMSFMEIGLNCIRRKNSQKSRKTASTLLIISRKENLSMNRKN